jgi:hypothetical protein
MESLPSAAAEVMDANDPTSTEPVNTHDAGADDDEDAMLAVLAGASDVSGDEELGLLVSEPPRIRLFGEGGAGHMRTSRSIHFYAMVRSFQQDALLDAATLASAATLAVQLGLLHGFAKAYYAGPAMAPAEWNGWGRTFGYSEADGGTSSAVAALFGLGFMPVVLIAKLDRTEEFHQTPTFRATLRHFAFYRRGARARTAALYLYWSFVYVTRAFGTIAYMCFTNAVLAAGTTSIKAIPLTVLVVAFLLDFDDYVYAVFFTQRTKIGAPKPAPSLTVNLGERTLEACEAIRHSTILTITVAQVVLMLLVKTHPWISAMWAIPLTGLALLASQSRTLPKFEPDFIPPWMPRWTISLEPIVVFAFVTWAYIMRCILTPVCGEGSRFWHGLDASAGGWPLV